MLFLSRIGCEQYFHVPWSAAAITLAYFDRASRLNQGNPAMPEDAQVEQERQCL